MLKKVYLILFLLMLGIGHLSAQSLTIRVENCDAGKGYLMIGVFNDEGTFPDSHFRGERINVTNGTMTIVFDHLPVGQVRSICISRQQ